VLCGCFTFPGRWPSGRTKQRPHSQWRDRAGFAPDFPVMPVVGTQTRSALYHDHMDAANTLDGVVRQNLPAPNATSRTPSGLARTSRWARILRWNAPSNRPAASWCDPKSAVCTTNTNGKLPDRVWLHRACDRRLDVEVCLPARSTASPNRTPTAYDADGPARVIERSPFSANWLRWKIACCELMAMDNI